MAQIVYIPQDVAEEGKQVLRDAGFEVRVGSAFDEATMIKEIQGCSAVLLRTAPFGAAVLEAGKDVKIVARHGAGYNNVDIAAADRLGIWVTNTPDATTNSVAEYTIGAILAATKKSFICAQAQKAGNYNYKNSHKGRDIAGLTLAVVGFGRIGRAVAKKAHFGLDMNIIAYDPYVKPESAPEYVKMVDWETAFSTADVVTIHMPATKDNGDCINKDTFALMKKANLPIYIGYAACIAVPPIVTFTLPGVPAMPNVMPTTFLGTTTWAAPVLSLATALTGIVLMVVYMQSLIKKARKNNIGYTEPEGEGLSLGPKTDDAEIPYPPFWKAFLPIVLIIALTSVFQLVLGMNAMTALVYGMWITSAVIVLMNWDVCVHKLTLKRILSQGCTEMFGFIFMAGCVYGFGKVTAASACFQPLINAFLNIHVNPYLTVWLSVCLIAGLCADGVGGMIMWLSIFGSQYGVGNAFGVNPAAVHRIAVSAATTFDSLPHSAMLAQGMAVFKTNLKESYKYSFMLTVVFPVIFSLVAVVGAIIFY